MPPVLWLFAPCLGLCYISAVQAELLDFTKTLLVAADLLDDSNTEHFDYLNDLDGLGIWAAPAEDLDSFWYEDGDGEHAFEDFISEILEMQATITLEMAVSLTGDGSRGSYNQYAKDMQSLQTFFWPLSSLLVINSGIKHIPLDSMHFIYNLYTCSIMYISPDSSLSSYACHIICPVVHNTQTHHHPL